VESKIVYFEERMPENAATTFRLVRERLQGGGINKLVLASTTGATARQALEFFRNDACQLIVVPHQWDFHRDNNPFPPELVQALREAGHDRYLKGLDGNVEALREALSGME
jgi:hypothetical protein